MAKWNYNGDMNLECGGYFWQRELPDDDFVMVIKIDPDSDAGGADNVFHIAGGSVCLDVSEEKRKAALECIGYEGTDADLTLAVLVDALMGYNGITDGDFHHTIRIGPIDPLTQDATVPEEYISQIRGNNKLKNYVRRNYL